MHIYIYMRTYVLNMNGNIWKHPWKKNKKHNTVNQGSPWKWD